mgnify:CR=1 FL=1
MSRMPPATGFFLGTNIVVFLALMLREGGTEISAETIADLGGLMPLQWLGDQYWRYLSYGFLHFSLMHITVNSICLLAWGVPLERWFGPLRMVILYIGSILIAGMGSVALHQSLFISAGASGGVSGLLGALFLLWLLRLVALPGSFFAINIGLNVAIALFTPGIDWQAHLAGFLGGMVLTGLILAARRIQHS